MGAFDFNNEFVQCQMLNKIISSYNEVYFPIKICIPFQQLSHSHPFNDSDEFQILADLKWTTWHQGDSRRFNTGNG